MTPEQKKALDKAKFKALAANNSNRAFLGPLLCNIKIIMTDEVPTAGVSGTTMAINPDWFFNLTPETQGDIIIHRLWHIGRLHEIRKGNRNHELWNQACDYRINNDMHQESKKIFDGIDLNTICFNPDFDRGGKLAEEDIYTILCQGKEQNKDKDPDKCEPDKKFMSDDLQHNLNGSKESDKDSEKNGKGLPRTLSKKDANELILTVASALQASKIAGNAPGDIDCLLSKLLKNQVDWNIILRKYLTEIGEREYTWRKPNRRYPDMYLPSLENAEGTLEHLVFFLDTSGSIADEQLEHFNSEVKYIWDTFKPLKLSVVTFDTRIRNEYTFVQGDRFKQLKVTGRGGTSLHRVYTYIMKHKPTASVIFSDMGVSPMPKVPYPVIFIVYDNPYFTSPYGKVIHIEDKDG